jgi:hypothetical protein
MNNMWQRNKNKYGNKKIVIDGIKFASQAEGRYYIFLKTQKENKKIIDFQMQVKIELQPKFKYEGKTVLPIHYIVDFIIYHKDGIQEYVDVKGYSTSEFKLKWKMLKYKVRNEQAVKLTIVKNF